MTDSFLPYADGGASSGNSRKALLLVAVGGVLLLVVGYFFVLPMFSSEADQVPITLDIEKKQPTGKVPAKKKPAAKPPARKPTSTTAFNDSVVRNPFKPLYIPPERQPSGVVGGAPTGGTVVPPPTSGGSTGGTGGSSTVVNGQRVALLKVFVRDGKQFAQTRVGETVYTPVVGGTFAGSFQLLATSGRTATYLFGDEQFTLSEGQEVLK